MFEKKKEEPKPKPVSEMTFEERYEHNRTQHEKHKQERGKTNG